MQAALGISRVHSSSMRLTVSLPLCAWPAQQEVAAHVSPSGGRVAAAQGPVKCISQVRPAMHVLHTRRIPFSICILTHTSQTSQPPRHHHFTQAQK